MVHPAQFQCRSTNLRSEQTNDQQNSMNEMHVREVIENQRRTNRKRQSEERRTGGLLKKSNHSPGEGIHAHAVVSEQLSHCLYRSKPCANPRALKQNGTLHTFCQYHRQKANETQRKVEARRRASRRAAAIKPMPLLTSIAMLEEGDPPFPSSLQVHSVVNVANNNGAEVVYRTVSNAAGSLLLEEDLTLLHKFLFQ